MHLGRPTGNYIKRIKNDNGKFKKKLKFRYKPQVRSFTYNIKEVCLK